MKAKFQSAFIPKFAMGKRPKGVATVATPGGPRPLGVCFIAANSVCLCRFSGISGFPTFPDSIKREPEPPSFPALKSSRGQLFKDLGPLRLIERNLFRQMKLREEVWGWTIEAQLRAAQLNEDILAFSIREKPRLAGFQKVSGVSAWRSAMIGLKIIQAGWRCKKRGLREKAGN